MNKNNLGEAIAIIGSLYLYLEHGLVWWITALVCVFAFFSWAFIMTNKEAIKLQNQLLTAKIGYYNRKEAPQ